MPNTVHPTAGRPSFLQILRLRLLKLLLLGGSSAIAVVWVVEARTAHVSLIDQMAYPCLIALFLLLCSVLVLRPQVLEFIERLSFATFAIYIVFHGQPGMLGAMTSYEFASLAQWIPLVYTAAFFFLTTRQAMLVSVMVYLSMTVPSWIQYVGSDATPLATDRGLLLLNIVCAHPVYIVTLSGIAMLKAHVQQTGVQAVILHEAANIDYLTGVLNRRAAAQLLHTTLERAHATGTSVSVILLDIDHFKCINDTFGHDVGDMVLIHIPRLLHAQLRASDTLGRWGGEEFVIITTQADALAAAHMAERARTQIASYTFAQIGPCTASFGVAVSCHDDTPVSLIKRADQALYRAKQGGRNRVAVAAPDVEV